MWRGLAGIAPGCDETFARIVQSHITPADRSRAGATVGLQDITIDGDRSLTQSGKIDHGPERSPDQALNLLIATRCAAPDPLRRRARKHRILCGDPTLPRVAQPSGGVVVDRCGAQDPRLAERDEDRTHRHRGEVAFERERTQLIRATAIETGDAHGRLRRLGSGSGCG